MKWNATIRKLLALALSLTLTLSLTTAAFATDGGGQSQTCNGTLGCKDGTHVEGCPEYKAPDSQTPVCTKDDSCTLTGDHDPSCPKYVVPCTKSAGCPATAGHDPNCPSHPEAAAIAEVRGLIDTLPTEVTETNKSDVEIQVATIQGKLDSMSESARGVVDATKLGPTKDALSNLSATDNGNGNPAEDGNAGNPPDNSGNSSGNEKQDEVTKDEEKKDEQVTPPPADPTPAPTPAEKLQQMIDALPAALAKLNPETDQEAAHNEVQKIYDFAANNGLELTEAQEEAIFKVFEPFYPRDTKAVAKIGNTEYTTLEEAFTSASSGEMIVLTNSVTLNGPSITVPADKTLTLDLNGNEITADNRENICVRGNLILKDSSNGSGKITSSADYGKDSSGIKHNSGLISVFGTFTMESGTINAVRNDAANKGHFGIQANTGSTVTINGGSITAGWYAISSNGNYKDVTMNINGGTLTSTADYAIYAPATGNSVLNVSNGTITGAAGGIAINAGKMNMTGGNVSTSGIGSTGSWGDGTGGLAPAAVNANAQYGDVNVSISDGTVTAGNDAVAVTTGTTHTAKVNITGGTYSSDVSAYVPDGYTDTPSGANHVIGKATQKTGDHVAEVNGQYFKELENAIAAANGGEVKLLKDTTGETVTVPAGSTVTLDLNGKTYTTSGATVFNNGILTVKDSSEPSTGKLISTGSYCIAAGSDSTTTVASGTIESVEGAIITDVSTGATINVTGGTLNASDNAVIAGNGSAREGKANTINISGGTLNGAIKTDGYVACGVYAPWKDNVNITGGTINVVGGAGVVARAGNVYISGGTITTSGNAIGKVGDSRVAVPCSAIVYDSDANYPAMTDDSKIDVTGGKFTSDSGVAAITNVGENVKIKVSGGTFSAPVDEKYRANGFETNEIKDANGKVIGYGVHQHTAAAELKNVKPATCKEEGYSGDTVCSVCGEIMKKGETKPKTDHTYGEWTKLDDCAKGGTVTSTCTVCGEKQPKTIAPTAHTYDETVWLSNEVDHWHKCTVCNSESTHEAHKFEWITVSRDASGSKMQWCSVCGYTSTTDWSKLELTVKANRSTVRPGKTITYTLTVTNKTGKDMDKVYVSGDLGKNLTFTKATGTGEYDKKNDLWIISDLKDGKSVKLTLKVTVKSGVKDGTKLEYTAAVTDAEAYNGETYYPDGSLARSTVTVKVSNKFSLIPETGDTSNIAIWITVLVVAALALIAAVVVFIIKSRKKK